MSIAQQAEQLLRRANFEYRCMMAMEDHDGSECLVVAALDVSTDLTIEETRRLNLILKPLARRGVSFVGITYSPKASLRWPGQRTIEAVYDPLAFDLFSDYSFSELITRFERHLPGSLLATRSAEMAMAEWDSNDASGHAFHFAFPEVAQGASSPTPGLKTRIGTSQDASRSAVDLLHLPSGPHTITSSDVWPAQLTITCAHAAANTHYSLAA